jgi:hypothetical protein
MNYYIETHVTNDTKQGGKPGGCILGDRRLAVIAGTAGCRTGIAQG